MRRANTPLQRAVAAVTLRAHLAPSLYAQE